jgi:dipeptidyl aminopeptidase/acylaminoacyl peptidase
VRVSRPVPRRAFAAASVLLACVAVPDVAAAAPEIVATPTTAGPPALVAWSSGRNVFVAGPDGVGRRVAARLDRVGELTALALSADGRRLAFVTNGLAAIPDRMTYRGTGAIRIADLSVGGPLRTLARDGHHDAVRWSPDGRRLLLLGHTIRMCDVAAQTPCRSVARRVQPLHGATWAPDGVRFAYVGAGGRTRPEDPDHLVLNDGAGHERVLERETESYRRSTLPVTPVWTARGLTWTTWTLSDGGEGDVIRTATRQLRPDGDVRTLTAAAPRGRTWLPFTVSSDSPGGEPIGFRHTVRGTGGSARLDARLMRLGPSGAATAWGLTLPEGPEDEQGTQPAYLGMLADGRAAVAARSGDADDVTAGRPAETTLHLVPPGGPLGPAVATGGVVSVATPFPAAVGGAF